MKICYEIRQACCCAPIGNACVAFLMHLIVHGCVCAVFIFTTYTEPPLNWLDYAFVISAVTLAGISLIALFFVKAKKCQIIRAFIGLLLCCGVISNIAFTIWYTIDRWSAEMLTLAMKGINPKLKPPDPIWYTWLVFCWFVCLLSIYYGVCFLSLFCNSYKTHLFTTPYKASNDYEMPDTSVEVRRYSMRYPEGQKPYPVQKH